MPHLSSPVPYREDINGLRAWAVIAVLLFHFKIPGLDAGFMGVDIFFVISGFLMTAIIVKGLENQNFSIFKFYMTRARRILPVLMVLILVLLTLGWFWLTSSDYKSLGQQSTSALLFMSNYLYFDQAGYFDRSSHEKWLLHTWSLAVEAQFYLLYPLVLVTLWKIRPRLQTLFIGLGLIFIGTLGLSISAAHWNPTAAFYLLPTRAWELAVGGLAFLIGREWLALQRFSKPLLWSGFGLWLLAIAVLDNTYAWPSGWALLPVLGTVLIILANQGQAKITVNPVAQWLGDRSYSLYLWHWPLVVALYFGGLQNDAVWIAGAIALSMLFAHLSYQFVEVPTRSYLSASGLKKEVFAIAIAFLAVFSVSTIVHNYTFNNRLAPQVEAIANEANNKYPLASQCIAVSDKTGKTVDCYYNHYKLGAIAVGDSHNYALFTGLGAAAEKFHLNALHWARSNCPTLIGAKFARGNPGCLEFNEDAFSRLKEFSPEIPVILISRLTKALIRGNEDPIEDQGRPFIYFDKVFKDGFDPKFQNQFRSSIVQTACMLAEQRPVYLVRPIPEMGKDVPLTLSRNILFGRGNDDIKIALNEYHQRHKLVWEAQDQAAKECGVKILNPLPYLCDDQYCYGSKNGQPLYFDDDHLSEYGNKFLEPMFEQVFHDQAVTK
jgi:peptidoglycan/LPS O-acetylase OafA/YrhL